MDFLIEAMLSFFLAGIIAFASTPVVKKFAQVVGAVDVPLDDRRMHKKPMARLGGLAIFFGFLTAVLIFADVNRQLRGILMGSVIIVVLGCIDDVVRLKASVKLIVQIIAALIPVYYDVRIQAFSNPFSFLAGGSWWELGGLAVPITVIWIVAITNSVNFIDGLDGLAAGVSAIGSISLMIIAFYMMEPNVTIIMAALAGGSIGFMPYNFNPAKLFMGDTGATFLGFILATVSIQGLFKFYTVVSFAVPFLILGLPIFDIVVSIFRRIFKGQSPAIADRSHIHHRLIDMGFSQKQAVAILYTVSAILGLTAVILTTSGELKAIFLLLSIMVAVAIGIKVMLPGAKGNGGANKIPEAGKSADPDKDAEDTSGNRS